MRRGLASLFCCLLLGFCVADANPDQCAGWKPIRPAHGESATLSPDLQAQLLEHNLHGAQLCGWKP